MHFSNNPAVQAQTIINNAIHRVYIILCSAACFQMSFCEYLAICSSSNISDGNSPLVCYEPLLLIILGLWLGAFSLKKTFSDIYMSWKISATCQGTPMGDQPLVGI
jgi:hypothetical protein